MYSIQNDTVRNYASHASSMNEAVMLRLSCIHADHEPATACGLCDPLGPSFGFWIPENKNMNFNEVQSFSGDMSESEKRF